MTIDAALLLEDFLAARFTTFLLADFFTAAFLTDFLLGDFLLVDFLAADFLAVFLAAFFAATFSPLLKCLGKEYPSAVMVNQLLA